MSLRIAFTGAGFIANIHATAARNQPDVELVAVVEKYSDKSQEFARKFGVKCCYSSVDELLQGDSVDALVVGTPNFLHAPQTIAALDAGIPVLVEKPMAMNAEEAEQMCAAADKSGAVLMVAHCWRFDEDVRWLKAQAHRLGRIIRTKGYGVHSHYGPSGWFTRKELAGGGALADMGIHAIDTARFLLGDPQPVSVYAKIGTYYGEYDVDDTGVIIVEWEDGALSYIESGWWQPHMDGPEASTQLYGTQGFGQLFPTHMEIPDSTGNGLEVIGSGSEFPRQDHSPQSIYDTQMAYFLNCIRNKETAVPGGLEGLTNMKIVDAAYRSSATGKVVKIK